MRAQEIQINALTNAIQRESTMNYQAIIEGFAAKGIPVDQIIPRENVFTFHAWKALGRCVRKNEHGVKVCTYVECKGKKDAGTQDSEAKGFKRPSGTTVFHISQTDPITKDVQQATN
jgi:antirestriction protein ArdC